jgi:hypothetical protein
MKASREADKRHYGRDFVQKEEGGYVGDWGVAERDYYALKKAWESGFEAFNAGSLGCWLGCTAS